MDKGEIINKNQLFFNHHGRTQSFYQFAGWSFTVIFCGWTICGERWIRGLHGMSGWTRILIFNYSFLIESTWSFIFHHNQQVTSMVFFCWKREPNFPISPFHPCSSVLSASSAYPSLTRFSFFIIHFSFVTTYFSGVTSVVSRRNKQSRRVWQAMSPSFTSNPVGFCLQSLRVW